MAANPLSKPAAKATKAKAPRVAAHADYSDVVTDEHIARIKNLVPDKEHADAKVVSGPAWPAW